VTPKMREAGLKRLVLASMAGICLLLIAAACSGDGEKTVTEKTVTGMVLEAVERSLVEIELLKVRDDTGKAWEFATEGNVGISAAHLRQHQVMGEGVVVTYKVVDGRLIATDVRDGPAPGN
jgi:hypothetical protein